MTTEAAMSQTALERLIAAATPRRGTWQPEFDIFIAAARQERAELVEALRNLASMASNWGLDGPPMVQAKALLAKHGGVG